MLFKDALQPQRETLDTAMRSHRGARAVAFISLALLKAGQAIWVFALSEVLDC